MGYEHLEIEHTGHVATVWLNRPEKLNAMSEDMWVDLPVAMADLDADDTIRVMVLAGRGPSFTVGIDIGMLSSLQPSGLSHAQANHRLYSQIRRLQLTASCLANSPKPVIAAVHGHCLGAGMDLITACDIRYGSADSVFSIRETRMAIVADVGTLQRLPAIVGSGHTAELAFSGADIDAARASEIGLLNRVFPDAATTQAAALELASEIASNSPLVVQGIKTILSANDGRSTADALEYVARWNATHLISGDLMEALAAFVEKRPPDFKGD
ncbi:MAG TPA: crotonase/enoyl-CoA hydratase family protein [Acidimicrobiia bacterium]|nr:crotonase/enoyl-CoA hydratase family protein [Acidimicrobiia bacterium]